MSTIARTLAGNPQVRSIDPVTGEMKSEPAPVSSKHLALAVAMEALAGAAAGAEAKPGPGVEGRAGGAGFGAGAELVGKQNEQSVDNSQQDYNRKLLITETNMRMHNQALQIGRLDQENNKSYVDSYKDIATTLQDQYPSFIKGYANYADLKNYNVTAEQAIPYQVIPRMGPDGKQAKDADGVPLSDINYMIVDPSLKASGLLNDKDAATGTKYHMGQAFSNPNLASTPISLRMLLGYKSQMSSLESVDGEIAQYYKQMNDSLPKSKQLAPLDIAGLTAHDATLAPAAIKFQAALVRTDNGAGGYSYIQALQTLAKTDPTAANKMAALLGGTANVAAFDKQNAPPRQPKNVAEAEAIKADPNATSEETKGADTLIAQNQKDQIALAGGKAGAEAQAKDNATAKTGNPNDVDAIGTGHIAPERMSYLLARNPQLLDDVMQKYPDFDSSKVESYQQTYKDFTSGKTANALNNGATALKHLQELSNLNTIASHIPHTNAWTAYQNQLDTVVSELGKFYGNDTIPGLAGYRKTLDTTLPGNRAAAIRQQAHSMGDKVDSYEQQWYNAAPSSAYQAPMPHIDDAAKAARATLDPTWTPQGHGQKIDLPTVKIYLRQNGNDAQKAAAAAKANGWNF
jgi:hypothetical protein